MEGRILYYYLFAIFILYLKIGKIRTGDRRKDFEKCSIPGIDKFFPVMRWNPCFQCTCDQQGDKELCRIKKERCPQLECSLQEFDPDKCCRSCKTCSYDGIAYKDQQIWTSKDKNCTKLQCKEGVISDITPKCVVTCNNPVQLKDKCCPTCQGCTHKNKKIKEGDWLRDGPCITCTCNNGSKSCQQQTCPLLQCKNPIKEDGDCCPKCNQSKAPLQISSKEPMCHFKDEQVENKDTVTLGKCTTCRCQNGTMVCPRKRCTKDNSCPEQDLVSSPEHCCPICREKLSCNYMGTVHENLKTWYLSGCVECQCVNGRNMCKKQICQKNIQCKPGYSASYRVGSCCLECLPDTKTCIGYGDPHYRTFDGKAYSYQGICKYTLTKDCTNQKTFSVTSRNSGKFSRGFSWIKTITLNYANLTITLGQKSKIKINGESVRIPFLYYPYIDIKLSKRYVYVYTKDGITIKWDGDSYVEVSLPKTLMNKVCGLCGNYNGNPVDDFKIPNGLELNNDDFGEYWRLKESKACKRHVKLLNRPQLATCTGWRLLHAHRICSKTFFDRSIGSCRWHVPTGIYFQDCLTDVCQCNFGKQNCECGAIRSYFNRCSTFIPQLSWKKKENCDSSCSGGSVFSTCGPRCEQTCDNLNSIEACATNTNCIPGCYCPAGFVWHHGKCIPPFHCPFK